MKYRGLVWFLMAAAAAAAACGGAGQTQTTGPLFATLEEETSVPVGYDASPPVEAPARPDGALGFSHYVFERLEGVVETTLVEGPREGQVRSSLSYADLARLYEGGGLAPAEMGMSREELGRLLGQLHALRRAMAEFRDIETAKSLGYVQTGGEVPNMGIHLASPARIRDGKFDPSRPEMLLFGRDGDGGWKLVGASFILPTRLAGYDHPEGFTGPLDNWHVHYNQCNTEKGTFSATREECEAHGGEWSFSFGWMLHAYVEVDNPLGVFSMWNPNVAPVVPAEVVRETRTQGYPEEQEEAAEGHALFGFMCTLQP
ncbi:MAG: hypothetical protein FJ312_09680 [SAR202 cluster bacterium]|nr:hypothetical protein [SAR202 cluster bacterium]